MGGVIAEYNVELQDDVNLHYYDKLLNKYKEWIEFKREIKIMSLLENKRIQYDVKPESNLSSVIYGYIGKEDNIKSTIEYTGFIVTDLQFIIKNSFVESLKIKIRTIDKKLENVISNCPDVKFKIKQHLENNNVSYFFIDSLDLIEKENPL